MHDLRVWPGVAGDGTDEFSTPGKAKSSSDQMERLSKVRTSILILTDTHTVIHTYTHSYT